jgi:hypothetical protein
MKIINHGKWLPYQPARLPPSAPPNTLFACRESDQIDWYDYVNSGKRFRADSIKLMAIWREYAGGYVVGPAVTDATRLFPPDHIVFEITDYTGGDPQAEFGGKRYEPDTGTFSEITLAAIQSPLTKLIEELTARIAALEANQK